jgi:hypothetical protein
MQQSSFFVDTVIAVILLLVSFGIVLISMVLKTVLIVVLFVVIVSFDENLSSRLFFAFQMGVVS